MNFCQCVDSHDIIWEAQQNHFQLKFGFCRNTGGRWLTQSQFFKIKTTIIQNGDFVGSLSQYGGVPKIQPKKKITSKITKKMGHFKEKIICLKLFIMQKKHYFFPFRESQLSRGCLKGSPINNTRYHKRSTV